MDIDVLMGDIKIEDSNMMEQNDNGIEDDY
jgi:hypothetical protein